MSCPFQCQEVNTTPAVQEQQHVCDLKAVEKKFKGGGYASVVSGYMFFHSYEYKS